MQNYKKVLIIGILQANYYTLECVLLYRVQARDYNNKKRPASRSYGMLTGSVIGYFKHKCHKLDLDDGVIICINGNNSSTIIIGRFKPSNRVFFS